MYKEITINEEEMKNVVMTENDLINLIVEIDNWLKDYKNKIKSLDIYNQDVL